MPKCFVCTNCGRQDKKIGNMFRIFGPPKGADIGKWIEILSKYRTDGVVFDPNNPSHKVCIQHFEEECIVKQYKFFVKGEWSYLDRKNWALAPGALPTIFTNLKQKKKPPAVKPETDLRARSRGRPSRAPSADSRPHSPSPPPPESYSRKRKSTTKETESIKKENENADVSSSLPPPPENACFVCCSKESLSQTKDAYQNDYRAILLELLNIPQKLIRIYLKQFGPLQDWIFFCEGCLKLFDDCKNLKDKISLLQTDLEEKQKKIVAKYTPTFTTNTNQDTSASKRLRSNQTHEEAVADLRKHICFLSNPIVLVPQQVIPPNLDKIVLKEEKDDGDAVSLHSFHEDEDESLCDTNYIISEKTPAHITVSDEANQSKSFYCGLCDDFSAYENAALLAKHQNEVHSHSQQSDNQNKAETAANGTGSQDFSLFETRELFTQKKSIKRAPPDYRKLVPTYSCPNCPEVKDYRLNRYIQHLAIHHRRPFRCMECSELLPENEDVREQHWNDKHPDKEPSPDEGKFLKVKFRPGKIWTCLGFGCYKGFLTKGKMQKHENKCRILNSQLDTTKIEQIKCLQCQEGPFRSHVEWRFHRALAHPKRDSLSCLYCDKSFAEPIKDSELVLRNDGKLLRHLKSEHRAWDLTDFRIYEECEPCGIVFCPKLSKSLEKPDHDFTIHGIAKEKTYSCKVCSFTSSISSEIGNHMETQHFLSSFEKDNERSKESEPSSSSSLICHLCGMTLPPQNSIQHHLFLRHGIISEGCEIVTCPHTGCKYKTVSKLHLDSHLKRIHKVGVKPLQDNPHKCQHCPQRFVTLQGRITHLRRKHGIHDKPRNSCKYCNKDMRCAAVLKIHEAGHEKRLRRDHVKAQKAREKEVRRRRRTSVITAKRKRNRKALLATATIGNIDDAPSASLPKMNKLNGKQSGRTAVNIFKPRAKLVPLYSCPNCPEIKSYRLNRYIQHLAIHIRRPFKCCECSQLLPEDEALRDKHWNDNHLDKEPPSGQDKFVKIKLDPGQIWKCVGYGCFKGFFNKEERDQHELTCIILKRKLKKPKFQELNCLHCQEGPFRSVVEWRFHRALTHPEVDSISCLYCDEKFSEPLKDSDFVLRNDPKLSKHMNSGHKEMDWVDKKMYEECELCGVVFTTKGVLKNAKFPEKSDHVVNIHGIPRNEAYSCKVCSFKGRMYWNIEDHIETHYNSFKGERKPLKKKYSPICEHCGQLFQGLAPLNHHSFRIHGIVPEGLDVTSCPHAGCKYKSVVKWFVMDHFQRSHKDSASDTDIRRDFICELCGKGCRNQVGLKNHHLRTHKDGLHHHHNHNGKRRRSTQIFPCRYCGKAFLSKNKTILHEQALHENNESKPFKCDICFKQYAIKNYLRYHVTHIHEGKTRGRKN